MNIAVVGLAISDVLTCSVVAPFTIAVVVAARWLFDDAVCTFQALASYALTGVSLYLMALIAINRYYSLI